MVPELTVGRRGCHTAETAMVYAAMRQACINLDYSTASTEGRASCLIAGMDPRNTNRRESDRIPFGVECALPGMPGPSRAAQQPRPKKSVFRTLGVLLLTIVLILGAWQIGRGLYIHFKAPVAQATDDKKV